MIILNTPTIRRLVPLAAVCCAVLAAPSLASAAERYATPSPGGVANCSQQDPCSLETAVESAAAGDEVIVGPGTYNQGPSQVNATVANMSIHGTPGQPRPQINFSNVVGTGLLVSGGGTADLHHLTVDATGGGPAMRVVNTGGAAEDLVVRNTHNGACEVYSQTFRLRDSVCATTANNHAGLTYMNQTAAQKHTLTLRNVTAVGSGSPGLGMYVGTTATWKAEVDAKNVIVNGGTGGISTDIYANNGGSATAEAIVNLSHSNYDSRCESPGGGCAGGPGVSVTAPGSGTNQTAPPVFADSDFHQDPSSPTRDKGTADASVGTADVDGDPRSLGDAVDIGADEFVPPAPPPPPPPPPADPNDPPVDPPADSDPPAEGAVDTDPPETAIRKAPPNALAGTTVRFRFASDETGSSFQCKLDRGAFRPCKSGRRYRGLDVGRHRFMVRATDAAGNADPTAAKHGFRVLAD